VPDNAELYTGWWGKKSKRKFWGRYITLYIRNAKVNLISVIFISPSPYTQPTCVHIKHTLLR